MFEITPKQLKAILIKNHSSDFFISLAALLSEKLPRYAIDTDSRAAAFIAQCAHESVEFTRLKENLNYSAERLREVFKNRITPEKAASIAGRPEATANFIYADRNGNGPESSGDGYKYRGRGALQTTGRGNYQRAGRSLGIDLITSPDLLETLPVAISAACVFWQDNRLNALADTGDFTTLTKRVNGGLNGLEERKQYYDRALAVL